MGLAFEFAINFSLAALPAARTDQTWKVCHKHPLTTHLAWEDLQNMSHKVSPTEWD